MASLVPSPSTNERQLTPSQTVDLSQRPVPTTTTDLFDPTGGAAFNVQLRNVCLEMFHKLITPSPHQAQAACAARCVLTLYINLIIANLIR